MPPCAAGGLIPTAHGRPSRARLTYVFRIVISARKPHLSHYAAQPMLLYLLSAKTTRRKPRRKLTSPAASRARKGPPKGKQPAEYLNPETGATWSGRGPAPAWLAAASDRSEYLIYPSAGSPGTA